MDKRSGNSLEYYSFDQGGISSIPHGFFTRNGGVSPKPWASLNLSTTGGDSKDNVVENRRRIFETISKPVETLYDTWQVHGTKIINAKKPRGLENAPQRADGIITQQKNVTLFMRFADCVPILFFDPKKMVIGIAHAGWRGTVNRIAEKLVLKMVKEYGCEVGAISAGIGPCICSTHYVVKEDVLGVIQKKFPIDWKKLVSREKEQIHFDLQKTNKLILEKLGLTDISSSELCTACNTTEWYSHRAENGATGRFGVYIGF
jgi:YfiH family protein